MLGKAGPGQLTDLGSWALTGFELAAVEGDRSRYVISDKSVFLVRGNQGAVALVLVAGHDVAKSAHRMAKRLLRSILLPGKVLVTPISRPVEPVEVSSSVQADISEAQTEAG